MQVQLYLNGEVLSGNIVLEDGITTIPYGTFKNSSITSITIPDSITSIGDYAFYGCSSLTSVTIPNNVTSISSFAFYKCTSLTNVTFENAEDWWVSTYSSATSGTSIDLSDTETAATYLTSTYRGYYWFCTTD